MWGGWEGGTRAPYHQEVGVRKPTGVVGRVWASGRSEGKVAQGASKDASNQHQHQLFQHGLRPGPRESHSARGLLSPRKPQARPP